MKREEPYCEDCGGSDIIADATAQWDVDKQEWELGGTMDYFYCSDCDGWTKWIGWREVKDEPSVETA